MVDGLGLWLVGLGRVKLGLGDRGVGNWDGVNLVLGDCVWCVLLLESVANATNSSKTTPPVSHD